MVDEVVDNAITDLHISYEYGTDNYAADHRGCDDIQKIEAATDTREEFGCSPPLIVTFFAGGQASVVLGSYEDIILNETGMHMKMLGPGGNDSGEAVGNMQENFRWRRWGSSLPGLRTLDPPLRHPSTPVEIFWHTCLQSHLQTAPPTPQKSYTNFRNPRKTFENTPLFH